MFACILRFLFPCVLLLAFQGAVRAAPGQRAGQTAPLTQVLKGEAKVAYEAARLLVDANDFEGALLKFRLAYERQPDPRLLWNMASCERSLRHYRSVRDLTLEYIKKGNELGVLTLADKQDAEALLRALESLIGTVRIKVTPADAVAYVDGRPLSDAEAKAAEVTLDVGQHEFAFEKPGYRTSKITQVVSGIPVEVVVVLERTSAQLTVATDVNGAVISVDGVVKGSGSWSGDVEPGHRLLRVSASGHRPYEIDVAVADRERRELSIKLEKEKGSSSATWWILGGLAVAGAAASGYFIFRDTQAPLETGTLGSLQLL